MTVKRFKLQKVSEKCHKPNEASANENAERGCLHTEGNNRDDSKSFIADEASKKRNFKFSGVKFQNKKKRKNNRIQKSYKKSKKKVGAVDEKDREKMKEQAPKTVYFGP